MVLNLNVEISLSPFKPLRKILRDDQKPRKAAERNDKVKLLG